LRGQCRGAGTIAGMGRKVEGRSIAQFQPVRFEFEKKDEQINMRLPRPLLEEVKARAKARGIPYTGLIREALEMAMARK
jgi:predicted DNA binding CopG/RHH family protein